MYVDVTSRVACGREVKEGERRRQGKKSGGPGSGSPLVK